MRRIAITVLVTLVTITPFSPPQIVNDGRDVAFTEPALQDEREVIWIKDLSEPRASLSSPCSMREQPQREMP